MAALSSAKLLMYVFQSFQKTLVNLSKQLLAVGRENKFSHWKRKREVFAFHLLSHLAARGCSPQDTAHLSASWRAECSEEGQEQ